MKRKCYLKLRLQNKSVSKFLTIVELSWSLRLPHKSLGRGHEVSLFLLLLPVRSVSVTSTVGLHNRLQYTIDRLVVMMNELLIRSA